MTIDVTVREIQSDETWAAAVPVLRELWTDADDAFVSAFRNDPEYNALAAFRADAGDHGVERDPATPLAVAGVSVQSVLHHARHAWVHDFVVTEPARGEGVGAALLDAVEDWARERDCEYVALAVRDGNDAASAFYEAEGMTDWGRVYETELE